MEVSTALERLLPLLVFCSMVDNALVWERISLCTHHNGYLESSVARHMTMIKAEQPLHFLISRYDSSVV